MVNYMVILYSLGIILLFRTIDCAIKRDSCKNPLIVRTLKTSYLQHPHTRICFIYSYVGPYRVMLKYARRCPKTQIPREKVPTMALSLQMYNNSKHVTLLSGNFTVYRDTSKLKGKSRQFLWINGKWKLNLVMHSGVCDGIFITVMLAFLGGKHDRASCTIPLGEYRFKDLDVNKVNHLWAPTMVYGRELWKIEIISPTGVVDCLDIFNEVVPA